MVRILVVDMLAMQHGVQAGHAVPMHRQRHQYRVNRLGQIGRV